MTSAHPDEVEGADQQSCPRATRKPAAAKRPIGADGSAAKPSCVLRKLGRDVGWCDLWGKSKGELDVGLFPLIFRVGGRIVERDGFFHLPVLRRDVNRHLFLVHILGSSTEMLTNTTKSGRTFTFFGSSLGHH